jgi:hypothetical protein
MKTLKFSDQQVTQIEPDLQSNQGDYSHLQRIFLEPIIAAEREEFNLETGDKSNGFLPIKQIRTA